MQKLRSRLPLVLLGALAGLILQLAWLRSHGWDEAGVRIPAGLAGGAAALWLFGELAAWLLRMAGFDLWGYLKRAPSRAISNLLLLARHFINFIVDLCVEGNKGRLIAAIFMFAVFFFNYSIGGVGWWFHQNLQHDDSGYFAHVTTIVLDQDFDYTNETSMRMYSHKKGVPIAPLGPSIMALPFVAIFSTIDRAQNHPILSNHMKFFGSWTFFGFAFASSFYFFHGVYLFYLASLRLGRVSKLFVFLCSAGVGLLFYVLYRPIMSHSFEFWTLSFVVYASLKYVESKFSRRAWLWAFLAGLGSVLAWFCRLYAVYAFFLPYMVLLLWCALYAKSFSWRNYFGFFPKILFAQIVGWIGVLSINYAVYGVPIYAYGSGSNALSLFHNLGVIPVYTGFGSFLVSLFSEIFSRLSYLPVIIAGNSYGLLYFTPIIPIGITMLVLALVKMRKRNAIAVSIFSLLCLGYIAGPFLLVLMYQIAGSAYGFRYVWGIVPLGMIGLFMWKRFCWEKRLRQKVLVLVFLCLNIFSTAGVVAFITMPDICYRASNINEFGYKEVCSPRENLYRVIRWMGKSDFYNRAWQVTPYRIFYLAAQDQPITKFGSYHPNMPAQALVLCVSWLLGIIAFVFFKKEPGTSEAAQRT